MERKKKIILISIIAILLVLIIVLFLFFNPFTKKPAEEVLPPVNQNENQNISNGAIDSLPAPSPERVKSEKDYPLGLESLASSFAERFASYSSDAKFKNLQDLVILSTPKMKSFIDDFISTSNVGKNGYEAQEAKALNNQLIFLNQDKAVIVVSLQLTKVQGEQSEPVISYSKVELTLLKSGDEWKVDEAIWK